MLIDINKSFSAENEELKRKIKSNENIISSDDQGDNPRVIKKRNKEKNVIMDSAEFDNLMTEEPEKNEKDARVY